MSASAGLERAGRARIPAPDEDDSEEAPIAFVAVDLVALDGETLVEIPLLERKRLLESVLVEGSLVRRTPYVRHPAGTFIVTWRSFGFGGLAYKAANSRYLPGATNDDWCMTPMPRR
jgi:ATP-dependent DNA ligase